MKPVSLDLFALGVANMHNAAPIDRTAGKFNLYAVADVARLNFKESDLKIDIPPMSEIIKRIQYKR